MLYEKPTVAIKNEFGKRALIDLEEYEASPESFVLYTEVEELPKATPKAVKAKEVKTTDPLL